MSASASHTTRTAVRKNQPVATLEQAMLWHWPDVEGWAEEVGGAERGYQCAVRGQMSVVRAAEVCRLASQSAVWPLEAFRAQIGAAPAEEDDGKVRCLRSDRRAQAGA